MLARYTFRSICCLSAKVMPSGDHPPPIANSIGAIRMAMGGGVPAGEPGPPVNRVTHCSLRCLQRRPSSRRFPAQTPFFPWFASIDFY